LIRRRGSFAHDQGGATTIIVALSLTVLLTFTAMGIDIGSLFLQARRLQGMADLAAMAAANDLPHASAAAEGAVGVNHWQAPMTMQVTTGVYSARRAVDPSLRYAAGAPSPNAARVVLNSRADLTFGRLILGRDFVPITRTATAARGDLTSFSIGSRLASLQGGVANALLSSLTGSNVNLSVMDYNALAHADVGLFDYADALRTHLSLTGASYDKVLSSQVTARQALSVLADLLDDRGQDAGAAAIRKVATAVNESTPADLAGLIDAGPYGDQDHVAGGKAAGIQLNSLDMANAILTASQGGRQVKLDLGATVPGLASVTVWLGIGQRAANSSWLAVNDDGSTTVETVQTRLYLDTKVLPVAGVLGLAGVSAVRAPLLVELAAAKARLGDAVCTQDQAGRSATLLVQPSIGHASIADIDTSKINDFSRSLVEQPATLVDLLILKAGGQARIDVGGSTWQSVRFTQTEIAAGATKSVDSNDIVQSMVSSLLGKLQLSVQVLGLGLVLGKSALTSAVSATLAKAATPLDDLIASLTNALGVHLGQADVRVNGLRCKVAALVA
jgi:uncharacterized membrane protein